MEDLQDVLEDVTYMNAMSDDSPKPTKAWDLPDEATLQDFRARELASDPGAFDLERVCQETLGFYLFCRYCKESGGEAEAAKARFLEDVVRYKCTLGDKGKALLAVKMARRYLLPRAPRPQPSTIHEEGAAAAGQHHGLSYAWEEEEEEEEAEATAAAAGPKLDAQEGDLRRLPNTSLSRAELISCYHEALEAAERQLQAARQAGQRAVRGEEEGLAAAGGKEMREKVVSSSTASTHSPSGGSSVQHHAFLSPSSRAASARDAGAGAAGGRTAAAATAGAAAPLPLEYVNALGLGGHVKDEAVETVKRVAEPMVHEYLEAEGALHRQPVPPSAAQPGAPPASSQRGQRRHGQQAEGGAIALSPQQKGGLGGWRPGGGGGGGGGKKQQQHHSHRGGPGPKGANTPTPAAMPPGGVALPGGAVSPASAGSVMHGGEDSSMAEESLGLTNALPTTSVENAAAAAAAAAAAGTAGRLATPTVGALSRTTVAGLGASRGAVAAAAAAAGGGAGPVDGFSSTVANTSEATIKEPSSLVQQQPQQEQDFTRAPVPSPATPPPWQQQQGDEEELGAGGDGEGFFGRQRQRLSPALFDKLELLVWHHLATRLGPAFMASPLFKKYLQFAYLAKKPVSEEDFVLFRVLGRGGFGQVNGCKRCQTGKLYAMKVMNKRRVKAHQSEKLCWNERRILSLVDSPFVVCLKYAFTSKEDVFLILDLMRGGDLAFHLDKRGRFTMHEARYFAARTLLGLQHLHKNGIVYRDLKPDNILMDERGKTRISDLGLACKVTPDLVGTYGTRGYWAPEMLMKDSKGHRIRYTQCVDWFSFGCVIYEMIIGFSPFRSEGIYEWSGLTKKDKHKAIDMAVIGMEPEFDRRYFDEDAIDLCKKLLKKDPRRRLGAKGSADVMAHPWFLKGGIEWDVFLADAAEPPFVPNQDINAASQSVIGSFNDENQYRKMKIDEVDHEVYNGWSWVSQSAFFAEVVQFLKAEELQGPIVPAQSSEGCCAVS